MPTKIRLQRHGKKKYAYFHIVIADSRAPRDGKFIEKLGTYNPNTNPATIDFNFDSALKWVKEGAQPTDTVRAILSYKGVLYKNHLDRGVVKGAFTQEVADKKFEEWMEAKENKISAKSEKLGADAKADKEKRLEAEKEVNKKKADSIAAKNADLAGEVEETEEVKVEASEATETSEAAEEVKAEAKEEVKTETKEEAKTEPKAEAKAEPKEEVKAEDKGEDKKEEEKKA